MVSKQFKELWVELPNGQSMCALLNGDLGWLMHCDRTGDVSYHSIAPDFSGPADRQIDYCLNNGQ
ncbi:MAG: hypothetical protein AAF268_12650, partial [Cyanobacteria bacterium P01_A01_bin.3]